MFDGGHHEEEDILIKLDLAGVLHVFEEREHFHLNGLRVWCEDRVSYELAERVPTFSNDEITSRIVLWILVLFFDHSGD